VDTPQADGLVGAISVDVAGKLLYDMTYAGECCDPRSLEERDAVTGALIHRIPIRPIHAPFGFGGLAAVDGGVWASFGTGMQGAVELRDRRTLTVVTESVGGEKHPGMTNGVAVNLTKGVLWATDRGGQKILCGDPAMGFWRAEFMLPEGLAGLAPEISNVVELGGSYYVGTIEGIVRLGPQPLCRG
jgi:hypothetical protein